MNVIMSVVVPAHNESALIRRLVSRLAVDDRLEVVVVANGCTDDTADVARGISSRVTVVEIDEASKIAALNAGDQVATVWPRAYVDADVVVEPSALLAVGAALAGGALVCSPALRVATSGSSWAVRAYYRIWELTDYRRESHIGSGIYALSAEGRSRFTSFPPIIADDRFVQTRFAPSERVTLEEHHFEVEAPRDFRSLVHRQERIALGNLELRRREPETDNVAFPTAVPPVGRSARP